MGEPSSMVRRTWIMSISLAVHLAGGVASAHFSSRTKRGWADLWRGTAGPGVNANVDSKIARSGLIVARFYSRAVPRRKTTEVKSLKPWDHCNHVDLHQIGRIGETRYLQQGARGKRRLVRKIRTAHLTKLGAICFKVGQVACQ